MLGRTLRNTSRARNAAVEDVLIRHPEPVTRLFERWRERRQLARRIAALGDCGACGHPWAEHPGSGNECDGMCGECFYEFEHEQRESPAPGCRLPCPPLI